MATITCLFAANIAMDTGTSCRMHGHPCTEIVYYDGGEGLLKHGREQWAYRDRTVSVYQPPLQHSVQSHLASIHTCIGVTGCGADRLPIGLWPASRQLIEVIATLQQELRQPEALHDLSLDMLAGRIVLELRRMLNRQDDVTDSVEAARRIIDDRFHTPLTIRKLADEVFLHPDYLRQMFRRRIGQSPLHYLLRRRVEYACELLHWSEMSVKQVAAKVGVENPLYFSRLFSKQVGCSPSVYRTRVRAKELKTHREPGPKNP